MYENCPDIRGAIRACFRNQNVESKVERGNGASILFSCFIGLFLLEIKDASFEGRAKS